MTDSRAVLVKARAVLRAQGHSGDVGREYADWHIEIRSGAAYVSIWSSAAMVYLALGGIPVYHQAGPWEQYLDLLFQRGDR